MDTIYYFDVDHDDEYDSSIAAEDVVVAIYKLLDIFYKNLGVVLDEDDIVVIGE